MSSAYQQALIPVSDPKTFGSVHAAIAGAFSAARVKDFLRSLDQASMRIREFEAVLERGLLGPSMAAEYGRLNPGDQGQIREFYLHSLEQVEPELRSRYFKLYSYY